MSHVAQGSIQKVQFCPYEDVLGVGSSGGFESLLIPGQLVAYLVLYISMCEEGEKTLNGL